MMALRTPKVPLEGQLHFFPSAVTKMPQLKTRISNHSSPQQYNTTSQQDTGPSKGAGIQQETVVMSVSGWHPRNFGCALTAWKHCRHHHFWWCPNLSTSQAVNIQRLIGRGSSQTLPRLGLPVGPGWFLGVDHNTPAANRKNTRWNGKRI